MFKRSGVASLRILDAGDGGGGKSSTLVARQFCLLLTMDGNLSFRSGIYADRNFNVSYDDFKVLL